MSASSPAALGSGAASVLLPARRRLADPWLAPLPVRLLSALFRDHVLRAAAIMPPDGIPDGVIGPSARASAHSTPKFSNMGWTALVCIVGKCVVRGRATVSQVRAGASCP